jgi:hypothetical protein
MNHHNSIRYLVNSKTGMIWVSVDDKPWKVESNINEEPKRYFNTLKGIFYMREYPDSAAKLFNSYKESTELDQDTDDFNENFSRN